MNFQEMILTLNKFWGEQGCIIMQPYDIEKGAGTMNPATFYALWDRSHGMWLILSHAAVRLTDAMGKTQIGCSTIINIR